MFHRSDYHARRAMSRRDFVIGASALFCACTAAVLPTGGLALGHAERGGPSTYAYVGCYTTAERNGRGQGISVYQLRENNDWKLIQVLPTFPNPSFVIADDAGRTLYSAHGDGNLVSYYRIDPHTGRLTALGHQDTGGTNGVHIALSPDERFALVANYASGSLAIFPRDDSGRLGARSQLLPLTGTPGPMAADQKGPQPHEVSFDSTGTHVLVPDKGTDRVHRLRFDTQNGKLTLLGEPALTPAGSGPRHLAYHPTLPLLYLVDELSSELTAYRYDTLAADLSPTQVISTIPGDFEGDSTAAEIVITHDGRFAYVSNRGHDSIAAFGITPTGALIAPAFTPSGGQQPRFMTLSPDGRTLYAANQKTDTIVAFALESTTGQLIPTGRAIATNTPSSIAFVTPA